MAGRYGGGHGGRGGGGRPGGRRPEPIKGVRDDARLSQELLRMDGDSYGRYKSLKGDWDFGDFTLTVQRVQADPFAPPSRILVTIPDPGVPESAWGDPVRRRATADFLGRRAGRLLRRSLLRVDTGGQEVIERSSCRITDGGGVELRIGIDLPGRGRRIDGRAAERELCATLPGLVDDLDWDEIDRDAAAAFADSVVDTVALRSRLADLGLVAFVADGAILPRRSGVADEPLTEGAVPFASPADLRVTVDLPHRGTVTGMGVPEGITLIVGGGFHGKSTLLHALERGVHDHVPGDGRELVVARADAVKIRAEEGRRVERVDVGSFVRDLPTGADTADFRTDNASGSTSQAANICEALEAGSRTLLVDEDSTATNLMIRDERMQALVHGDREPLTPFVDLIRPLYRDHGVSTVLVMGGSGDYFDVADHVIMMDAYHPHDVTERARKLSRDRIDAVFTAPRDRVIDPASVDGTDARGRGRIKRRDMDVLVFGDDDIDVRSIEQFVDPGQIVGAGLALRALVRDGHLDGRRTLAEALDSLESALAEHGIIHVGADFGGDHALPRRQEVAAVLNRLRSLKVTEQRPRRG
ncbi:ABC-ATPase domain-containing protein [Nocardiopsis lambiniae]|uniref:ABC-ATPase domain-containing protein n=1 Tax=Nocardiopsis lambiniae TaxID=3075539 RepID=A0ABU2M5A1_9ACTN|nr:ABC-ATPase domain-containing protein [Nocardiopsis sp. DSM 44743]MDT0327335.1 ABC-ATPase domain-containing protein [Nocardiopsis sp. DSM 44743]